MKKKNWIVRVGIILIISCIPFFIFIAIIPFLEIDAKTKITYSTISLIIGEVMFWLGGILVGKELFIRIKSYFKPKKWLKKADKDKEAQ